MSFCQVVKISATRKAWIDTFALQVEFLALSPVSGMAIQAVRQTA
ncbi:hypothetical protein LHGZ1_0869 [Laribacter hongkongensis]|uniref:Uncharacterized protein n=1 Tax=Laribacter hongkongensis TaxID=168471 RepID=A0A248LFV3_9NEIS|nr:hypothetical protein LHGZ1_0869 [Laribacter hongkongensis]